MPLAAVTFDFHNTLASCDAWFEMEIRTLVPRVIEWDAARHAKTIEPDVYDRAVAAYRTLRQEIIRHGEELDALACTMHVLKDLGIVIEQSEAETAIKAIMLQALDSSYPVAGSVSAVRNLARAGIPLGVVSSAVYHPFLEWSLDKFGILEAFDVVVTSASAGYYKTRPEIYAHTLVALGAAPQDSVHIGDSYAYDVKGARRAGMRTVWYADGQARPEYNEADLTVSTLEGLAEILLNHFGEGR
jgi:HAD superfamily hydrolase (TIGR01509 family)